MSTEVWWYSLIVYICINREICEHFVIFINCCKWGSSFLVLKKTFLQIFAVNKFMKLSHCGCRRKCLTAKKHLLFSQKVSVIWVLYTRHLVDIERECMSQTHPTIVQSQQWKHQINVWNLFIDVVLVSLLLFYCCADFTHFSAVSTVDFEQVNAGWGDCPSKLAVYIALKKYVSLDEQFEWLSSKMFLFFIVCLLD